MKARPAPDTPGRSAWPVVGLALLPLACCGLPLLVASVTAVGAGAVVGGGIGLALVAVTGLVLGAVARKRRRRCR